MGTIESRRATWPFVVALIAASAVLDSGCVTTRGPDAIKFHDEPAKAPLVAVYIGKHSHRGPLL